jgi:hypothetical protein
LAVLYTLIAHFTHVSILTDLFHHFLYSSSKIQLSIVERGKLVKWVTWTLMMLLLTSCYAGMPQSPSSQNEKDQWITTESGVAKLEGGYLVFAGPNLSNQVGQGKVYTYFAPHKWVALLWEGHIDGKNTWKVPEELKADKPDWATNTEWTVDFWWPAARGEIPPGTKPGTSR